MLDLLYGMSYRPGKYRASHPDRRLSKPEGASLLELLLALALLAITMVSVFSVLVPSKHRERQLQLRAVASDIVAAEISGVEQSVESDTPVGERARFWDQEFPKPSTPFREDSLPVGGQEFRFQVFAETIAGTPGLGIDGNGHRMKRVTVVVTWDYEGSGRGANTFEGVRILAEPGE